MEIPQFRKSDRYKRSSYRTYNYGRPETYDTCIWLKALQVTRWDEALLAEIGPQIPTLRILDVGCATGRQLLRLGQAGANQLTGLDLAPRIVEVAGHQLAAAGLTADLKSGDAEERLPWPDSSFDVVCLSGVLHHFFRPQDALAEIARVLVPQGRLIMLEPWFVTPLRQIFNLYLRIFPSAGDCRFRSPRAADKLLVNAGWNTLHWRRVGLWGFLWVGHKPA